MKLPFNLKTMEVSEYKDSTTPLLIEEKARLAKDDNYQHDDQFYQDQAERNVLGMTAKEAEESYYEYNLEWEKQMRLGNFNWY